MGMPIRLDRKPLSTYSIVGVDVDAAECGVAVQSKFLAAGAIVPWARGGVGAVATQAFANVAFGNEGLDLLAAGRSPQEALDGMLDSDEMAQHRQVGIVAADGRSAAFTGSECIEYATSVTGHGFAAQGNILTSSAVTEAMAETFMSASGPLADRLIRALIAGQAAGGEKRGMEAAGLLVVRPDAGYGGTNDRWIDLRVDHSDDPIADLEKLLRLHSLYFGKSSESDLIPFDPPLRTEVQGLLVSVGSWDPSAGLEENLFGWVGWNNLEERWTGMERLDPLVVEQLRNAARNP
jgi:uncharacterized Ntn-hydrolase superfamily protein